MRRAPEIHVFLLWEQARALAEDRVLADLRTRFSVLAEIEVEWPRGPEFAVELSRFYGDHLPPNVDKQQHTGDGPFLAVVVEVTRPRYGRQPGRRRPVLVNLDAYDARATYRRWTDGHNRVHGSLDPSEARSNLALLFGTTPDAVRAGALADRTRQGPQAGWDGWRDLREVEVCLAACGGARFLHADAHSVVVAAQDPWWVRLVLGVPADDDGRHRVVVSGRPVRVEVVEERSRLRRAQQSLRRVLAR